MQACLTSSSTSSGGVDGSQMAGSLQGADGVVRGRVVVVSVRVRDTGSDDVFAEHDRSRDADGGGGGADRTTPPPTTTHGAWCRRSGSPMPRCGDDDEPLARRGSARRTYRLEGSKARGGRRVKRMKVDLASMSMGPPMAIGNAGRSGTKAANVGDAGGMFSDILPRAGGRAHGNALLCFLSQETFVGFVELQAEGRRHVLKLNGSESLTECDRSLCNVQDCCGDKAFLVSAQSQQSTYGKRKRIASGAERGRRRLCGL